MKPITTFKPLPPINYLGRLIFDLDTLLDKGWTTDMIVSFLPDKPVWDAAEIYKAENFLKENFS